LQSIAVREKKNASLKCNFVPKKVTILHSCTNSWEILLTTQPIAVRSGLPLVERFYSLPRGLVNAKLCGHICREQVMELTSGDLTEETGKLLSLPREAKDAIPMPSAKALDVVRGMAGWTKRWTDALSDEDMARVLRVEFGGMNEVLYNLYAVTGVKDYAEAAHRFDHERLFGPLAEGRDELKGLHVNTQIPKIIGAARRYELTGDARYRRIAEFFWTQVTQHRAYATGGTSNEEHWRSDPDKLAGELSYSTEECCCTYNMLKLTRHLFAWSPEARYFDYYERAFLNGILGTMNPKNGLTMYYVPLATGYWKVFASPRGSFWCCTGTGVESFSKLADSIYFHDENGLYVNLFLASELDWEEKGIRLRQDTAFFSRGETRLKK